MSTLASNRKLMIQTFSLPVHASQLPLLPTSHYLSTEIRNTGAVGTNLTIDKDIPAVVRLRQVLKSILVIKV
jgi:hypothetical protein